MGSVPEAEAKNTPLYLCCLYLNSNMKTSVFILAVAALAITHGYPQEEIEEKLPWELKKYQMNIYETCNEITMDLDEKYNSAHVGDTCCYYVHEVLYGRRDGKRPLIDWEKE